MQRYLGTPNLAWDFLTLAEPERWDDYFAAADLPRAAGADFVVGGRRYGLFAHDFRRVPVDALLELVTERALAQDVTPSPPTVEPPLLVLSQPEFDDAVRQALRDLRRPDLLARNPLLRTRLVRDRAGDEEPGAATLEALVWAAVETLREHPRDDKLWRAVERTYVRPAATQERAAAALGLPFSTYRRHLTQGVDRVVAWLWDQEVYGEHPSTTEQRTEHASGPGNRATRPRRSLPATNRGGGCDEQADRRPRRRARREHGGAAGRPGARRRLRAGDGDRPRRAARGADAPARRPPRPAHPRAARRAGSRSWRSCSPGSPRSWSPHGAPAGDMLADARLLPQRPPAPRRRAPG